MKYQVLSPDNFPITHDGAFFRSIRQAKIALFKWVDKYKEQGYYSQICYNGYKRQISLEELPDYCNIVKI